MPIPIAMDADTTQVSDQLKRLAQSVKNIHKGGGHNPPKANLGGIAGHLKNVADTLDAGNAAGSVSADQYRTMADSFQAIADELRP